MAKELKQKKGVNEEVATNALGEEVHRVETKKFNRSIKKAAAAGRTDSKVKGANPRILELANLPEEEWYPMAMKALDDYGKRLVVNMGSEFASKPSEKAALKGTYESIIRRAQNYDLLTIEEEVLFIRLYQEKGDVIANEYLAMANVKFVISMIKDRGLYGTSMTPEDFIQEGMVGIQIVLDKYDPHKGFQLVTIMSSYVNQNIIDSINKNSRTIRIPANVIAQQARLRKATEYLNKLYGDYSWDDEDLLEEANRNYLDRPNQIIRPHHLEVIRKYTQEAMSLNAVYSDDNKRDGSESTLESYLVDEDAPTTEEIYHANELTASMIRIAKEELTNEEIVFLDESLGLWSDKKTQKLMIEELGLDRKSFKQKQEDIYNRLKKRLKQEGLHAYTEKHGRGV